MFPPDAFDLVTRVGLVVLGFFYFGNFAKLVIIYLVEMSQ